MKKLKQASYGETPNWMKGNKLLLHGYRLE